MSGLLDLAISVGSVVRTYVIQPWDQMLFGPRPTCDSALGPNAIWPWDHMCFGPGTICVSALGPYVTWPWAQM